MRGQRMDERKGEVGVRAGMCCGKAETFCSTSVIAWIEAPYFTSSSITLMRFFLQAMCSGVKPFCAKDNPVSQKHAGTRLVTQLHAAQGRQSCHIVTSCYHFWVLGFSSERKRWGVYTGRHWSR